MALIRRDRQRLFQHSWCSLVETYHPHSVCLVGPQWNLLRPETLSEMKSTGCNSDRHMGPHLMAASLEP